MTSDDEFDLTRVMEMMSAHGARRLYVKILAPNDNSKNQPYFGGDFGVLNILPAGPPVAASTGVHSQSIFKAPLDFSWLDSTGQLFPAPHAKLILYPQYPEVRFSGYLQGCVKGPSSQMGATRVRNRLLFLGVREDGKIIGYAAAPESAVAHQFATYKELESVGVFLQVPIADSKGSQADRVALLLEFCRISEKKWIAAKKLNRDGSLSACSAPNCGGYTLEAELGIHPNGYAEPDYRGWEVKQHSVLDFDRFAGGPITLMTPEPSGGFYATAGVIAFVERYGYADMRGREDRRNFGGIHRYVAECSRTKLTLQLSGYDPMVGKITNAAGGIALLDVEGREAAIWPYVDLMTHWNRKHASAAYVPSLVKTDDGHWYRYASRVRLGIGTDFLKFLSAVALGMIYYDPAVKVENYSTKPRSKRRSQFRIKSADLPALYHRMDTLNACKPR
jgi:hypothetical protein